MPLPGNIVRCTVYVAIDSFVPYEGHLCLNLVVWSTDNIAQLMQLTAEHIILYRVGTVTNAAHSV